MYYAVYSVPWMSYVSTLHVDDGVFPSFPLQSSFEEFLDLEALACEERVIVQYAAVNSRGRSHWSPATSVSVYGVQGSGVCVCITQCTRAHVLQSTSVQCVT